MPSEGVRQSVSNGSTASLWEAYEYSDLSLMPLTLLITAHSVEMAYSAVVYSDVLTFTTMCELDAMPIAKACMNKAIFCLAFDSIMWFVDLMIALEHNKT